MRVAATEISLDTLGKGIALSETNYSAEAIFAEITPALTRSMQLYGAAADKAGSLPAIFSALSDLKPVVANAQGKVIVGPNVQVAMQHVQLTGGIMSFCLGIVNTTGETKSVQVELSLVENPAFRLLAPPKPFPLRDRFLFITFGLLPIPSNISPIADYHFIAKAVY